MGGEYTIINTLVLHGHGSGPLLLRRGSPGFGLPPLPTASGLRPRILLLPPLYRRPLRPRPRLHRNIPSPRPTALNTRHLGPNRRQLLPPLRIPREPLLGFPPRVGLCGQQAYALLARRLGRLLFHRGGRGPRVAQPAVPLRGHLDLGVRRCARVVDYTAPVGGAGGPEGPVGVALEVVALCVLAGSIFAVGISREGKAAGGAGRVRTD